MTRYPAVDGLRPQYGIQKAVFRVQPPAPSPRVARPMHSCRVVLSMRQVRSDTKLQRLASPRLAGLICSFVNCPNPKIE